MKRFILMVLFFLLSCSAFARDIKVLTIDDQVINPIVKEYIEDGLKAAEKENSLCVIIKINTPGGLLKTTQDIVKLLLNSKIPIITYVSPEGSRAASAGAFICYASHLVVMSPASHIGAAHPVLGGGSWGNMDETMKAKVMNDTLAWAKNISEKTGRSYKVLESMINESKSLTAQEALKKGVIDHIAIDLDELIEKVNKSQIKIEETKHIVDFSGVVFDDIKMTTRQNFIDKILDPNIAYLLFTLGFLALIFEFTHPGFGFPGIAGAISILTAAYAFQILPVNYAGVALLALGIIFIVVEAFTPTFGLFTLGGLTAFVMGSLLLFKAQPVFKISWSVLLPVVIFNLFWSLFFLTKIIQARFLKKVSGKESFLGKTAIVEELIDLDGKIFFDGTLWSAYAEEKIEKGEEVVIIKVDGLRLQVKRGS